MQFCIRCGTATTHIVCLSDRLLCKLLWGCSLGMVYYCSEMCHECQRGRYIIWNLTDGFIQPVQYVEVTSLTSDVITAKEMRERAEKQSPQTVITSHFGGAENKRSWNERKYQILYNNGVQMGSNKSLTLYRFHLIRVCDTAHGVVLLGVSFKTFFLYDLCIMLPGWWHIEGSGRKRKISERTHANYLWISTSAQICICESITGN